jgi:hypothetical protein
VFWEGQWRSEKNTGATSAEWVVNVASDDRRLQDRIGKGAKVISGQSRDDAITKAKAYVDGLLK